MESTSRKASCLLGLFPRYLFEERYCRTKILITKVKRSRLCEPAQTFNILFHYDPRAFRHVVGKDLRPQVTHNLAKDLWFYFKDNLAKTSLFKSLISGPDSNRHWYSPGHYYPELGAQMKPLGDAFVKPLR